MVHTGGRESCSGHSRGADGPGGQRERRGSLEQLCPAELSAAMAVFCARSVQPRSHSLPVASEQLKCGSCD